MSKPLLERLGGRKFVICSAGLVLVPVLAALKAPGDAYLALGGIVASFAASNAVVTKASLTRTPDV